MISELQRNIKGSTRIILSGKVSFKNPHTNLEGKSQGKLAIKREESYHSPSCKYTNLCKYTNFPFCSLTQSHS